MAKKKYDSEDGVWRTIGGRRVFIRTGQSLSSAMKESGKFKNMRKDVADNVEFKDMEEDTIKRQGVTAKEYQRAGDNLAQKKSEYNVVKEREKEINAEARYHSEKGVNIQEYEDELREAQKKYDDLMKKDGHLERKYKMPTKNEEYEKKEFDREAQKKYDDLIEKNRQRDKENWEKGISYSDYSLDKAIEKKTNGKYKSYDEIEEDKNIARTYNQVDKEWNNLAKKARAEQLRDIDRMQKGNRKEYELYKRAKENPDSIDPMTENSTDWEALDKKYSGRYEKEKYGIGDNVKYEDGVTGKVVSKPTNGRMTVEWEDGTKNTYSENHPGIKKDTRVSRNSDKYTSEEYTGDISDLKARHTGQYIQNYKDEANEKIRNVLTGKSRADKSLEKYGLRVERDNSAQKEFGKRYFGKNVDIVDEKTGRMIHSSYDNYYDWDNSINAKPSVNSQDGKEWHTIKSGRYSKERKNAINEFNYYDYLKKPNNDYKENSLGEKVAQFRKDKEYLKQHENEIKRANEVANRYMKTKYELDEYKERKSAKPDYDHFAGWELYSDDPNRYGDIVRNHNERNALKDRYQGTYNYLQSTTNMSGAEILELLKKIDEDRK